MRIREAMTNRVARIRPEASMFEAAEPAGDPARGP
jgi:hypothetical protein